MTLWQRFYKAIGGLGPNDPLGDVPNGVFGFHGPSQIAVFLMWLGFLAYDPDLPDRESGWFYNMKWQWAFWKGPYHDFVVRHHDRPGFNMKMRWMRSRAPWSSL